MKLLFYLCPIDVDSAHLASYEHCRTSFPDVIPEIMGYCDFISRHPGCGLMDYSVSIGLGDGFSKTLQMRYLQSMSEKIDYAYTRFLSLYLRLLSARAKVELVFDYRAVFGSLIDKNEQKAVVKKVEGIFTEGMERISIRQDVGSDDTDMNISSDSNGSTIIYDQFSNIGKITRFSSEDVQKITPIYLAGKFDLLTRKAIPKNSIYTICEVDKIMLDGR
jgi:hypothetical protein